MTQVDKLGSFKTEMGRDGEEVLQSCGKSLEEVDQGRARGMKPSLWRGDELGVGLEP